MLADPTARPVARPLALMLALEALEELQVTEFVRFCVLPSPKVPVAVNWSVVPLAIDALTALIVIDCRIGPLAVLTVKFTPLCDAPLMATA
jgi:hypothetical protein